MRLLNSNETNNMEFLTEKGIPFTLIEPTQTGLKKSIMDATSTVRFFLETNSIHDYKQQKQGVDNKLIYPASIVTDINYYDTEASLYRPETKKGDPRIWFSKLKKHTSPNDILSILFYKDRLYIVNLTKYNIRNLFNNPIDNPIKEFLHTLYDDEMQVANELLSKMRELASMGFIRAEVDADTGVGRTLETLLGIKINSSKSPDYKGIEIKSNRIKLHSQNRKGLFCQVPNWELSNFKSCEAILNKFGYYANGIFRLYCTVNSLTPNSQGLYWQIDESSQLLTEKSEKYGPVATWELNKLHERLLTKHHETFWVSVTSKKEDGKEYFRYDRIEHTKNPIVSQFDILIQQGKITLDHLIKQETSGNVTEGGPSFKIKPNAINLLFPQSTIYEL